MEEVKEVPPEQVHAETIALLMQSTQKYRPIVIEALKKNDWDYEKAFQSLMHEELATPGGPSESFAYDLKEDLEKLVFRNIESDPSLKHYL